LPPIPSPEPTATLEPATVESATPSVP
jgi:hypothetical protein